MIVDEIFTKFREYGSGAYLGEPVSMTEHMLQSAYAAEQEGAPPRLVAAALLHDYGHFIHDLPDDSAEHGVDTQHEEVAHAFLSEHFGPEIAEPIRVPDVNAFYKAYQTFGRMLEEPRYRIQFKLDQGDLFIVDNLRVLHGRTGYSESGERHLQGCYADRDGLRSTLAVLRR